MMSSAIPARLTFQCGHAALVTLPRVKGETSAQRTERVAREKSAALGRQCDFCGPTVEVALVSNGNHVADLADVLVAEPNILALAETNGEVEVAEEVAETLAEVLETIETVEEAIELEDALSEEPEAETVIIIEPVMADEAIEPANAPAQRKPRRQRQRQRPVADVVQQAAPAATHAWVIEYQVERVVRAKDIREALRQVTSSGAAQVLSITRED